MTRNRLLAALLALCLALCAASCGGAFSKTRGVPVIDGLNYTGTLPLEYADQFAVYHYEGGYSLIEIVNSDRILVVPEGKPVPAELEEDIVVVQQPLRDVYLAATSAMALFESLDAMDRISFVGSKHWYTARAAEALENGTFVYAGKYNAPDYELLLNGQCRLAVESTMILHNPDVREKLIELGIPTVVERSSYEEHPLGRTEWIKAYGALFGLEERAGTAFAAEEEKVRALEALEGTGKTVAFFYVNSAGNVVTYKTSGYVPAMIRIAGGEYVFSDLGLDDDGRLSTVNMNMEQFYAAARNADFIIYNCSIASQLYTAADLLSLSPVLEDFKAVKEGNVWCTTESMFQQTDKTGSIIEEMSRIFHGQTDGSDLTYLFPLR